MLMSSIFLHAFVYLYLYINIVRTHNISYCNLEAFTSDLFLLSSAILYYFFFSLLLLLVYQLNSINDNIHVLCPCVCVVWKSKNKAVDSITFAYISIEMSVTGDGMEFEIRIRFPSIPIFHWHHIYHPHLSSEVDADTMNMVDTRILLKVNQPYNSSEEWNAVNDASKFKSIMLETLSEHSHNCRRDRQVCTMHCRYKHCMCEIFYAISVFLFPAKQFISLFRT